MLHVERGYTRLESYEYLYKNAVRMYMKVSYLVPVHSKTHHTDVLPLNKDFVRRETEPRTSDSVACLPCTRGTRYAEGEYEATRDPSTYEYLYNKAVRTLLKCHTRSKTHHMDILLQYKVYS